MTLTANDSFNPVGKKRGSLSPTLLFATGEAVIWL